MKKMNKYLVLAVAAAFSMNANVADAATATGDASAQIVPAISIVSVNDLDFGSMSVETAGGTVVISPAGARSKTGDVSLSSVNAGAAASFTVSGYSTSTYAITLPAAAITLSSGANSMSVGTFTSNPSGNGALVAGTETLTVGATLTVAGSQAAGTYTGTFDVSVEYN